MSKTPAVAAALALAALSFPSCASNDDLEERMNQRNAAYSDYNERRNIRLDARQERTDMWFERHMD